MLAAIGAAKTVEESLDVLPFDIRANYPCGFGEEASVELDCSWREALSAGFEKVAYQFFRLETVQSQSSYR